MLDHGQCSYGRENDCVQALVHMSPHFQDEVDCRCNEETEEKCHWDRHREPQLEEVLLHEVHKLVHDYLRHP